MSAGGLFPWLRRQTQPAAKAPAAAHLRLGREGEDAAAALLARKGYAVLDRNWRQGRLELDLVCRDGATLVFVEVKTRAHAEHGGPAAALTPTKQRTLCRAAAAWLTAHAAWEQPCRFDLVCALRQGTDLYLEHYIHAFVCPSSLDRSHAARQSW